jgi:hypothetical protein
MVRHGKPGIMLDRIFSEHKLRGSDSTRFPGGDGYFVRTTDGKRIGSLSPPSPPPRFPPPASTTTATTFAAAAVPA